MADGQAAQATTVENADPPYTELDTQEMITLLMTCRTKDLVTLVFRRIKERFTASATNMGEGICALHQVPHLNDRGLAKCTCHALLHIWENEYIVTLS